MEILKSTGYHLGVMSCILKCKCSVPKSKLSLFCQSGQEITGNAVTTDHVSLPDLFAISNLAQTEFEFCRHCTVDAGLFSGFPLDMFQFCSSQDIWECESFSMGCIWITLITN